ncbi:UDP-N-acetyl-D-mannosamine dehydrogenase [Paeniglutamicibacter psychrophenolicus]|uniref:UDP-N-acetyl-D-mannosaminuronic acid dehydrogenase n=1 Tax=Paeniglutamicibacter psychrophenolicus TaxID=257454 RepID=A0ABS4WE23_9MICC|nr:UDP-N-acetyl-D-mannosamine dehydrogenase [Paeniglutamicibacter psychrophenolicus]MBP2374447.1 UDP-N-acetyl-D-mannosaminuronic acid dehydrogenase [Paeniglutamicibacter psychrophenolicus]
MCEVDVCVVGLGYIGLPTSLVLATNGSKVHGVDVADSVTSRLQAGLATFEEPGLQDALDAAIGTDNLTVSDRTVPASTYIIAVPTPIGSDKSPDTSYIQAAAVQIAGHIQPGGLVILESTSPVGTTEFVAKTIYSLRPDLDSGDLAFAHCPERVIPGSMLREITVNDRIVGGLNPQDAARAATLYRTFCTGEVHLTDARTAEITKLAENSFRDVNIAFANELSMVAEGLGIDPWEVISLANKHPRVNILQPGPGVGGHCIAVDPWFLISSAPNETKLIKAARIVNDFKPSFVSEKIKRELESSDGTSVAILGLAFKANVDDLRGSPSVEIVEELASSRPDLLIRVVEPFITDLPSNFRQYSNIRLDSLEACLENEELIVLLVDHDLFKKVDMSLLATKRIIDTRGMWRELNV